MRINYNLSLFWASRMFTFVISLFLIFISQIINAQDDLLDKHFGVQGKQLSTGGKGDNQIKFIHRQRDGKILFGANVQYGKIYKLTLTRLDDTGKVDSSFGNNGILLSDVGQIKLDSFENIYIGSINQSNFRISKYNNAGKSDFIFGNNGNLDLSFTNKNASANIKILNEKIYIIGNLNSKNSYPYDVQKYDLNGTKDNTFGQNGAINFSNDIRRPDLKVTEDNKIIVAGGGDYNIIIRKYLLSGSLDTSFGLKGEVNFNDTTMRHNAEAVQLQRDQKILILGRANRPSGYRFLGRFTANGILDTGFANNGFLKITINGAYPGNLYAFSDDKYITTVHIERITYYNSITIKRFYLNGNADTTFANKGLLTVEFDRLSGSDGVATMDFNGYFLLANSIYNFSKNHYMQISLLNPEVKIDSSFDNDGQLDLFMGYYGIYSSQLIFLNDTSFIQGGTQYYSWGSNIQLNRFNNNGIPVFNWAGNGVYTPSSQRVFLYNNFGILQPDGKILIGGTASIDTLTEFPTQMFVCRILPEGNLDSSFGQHGISFISDKYLGYSSAHAIALERDGKILIGGSSFTYPSLLRLDENGVNKLIFEKLKTAGNSITKKILLTQDGKIYNIGVGFNSNPINYYSHITRFLPDGKLDLEFGDSASTKIFSPTNSIVIQSAALDQQERIILVGYDTIQGSDSSMLACRVLPNGMIDTSFADKGYFRYRVNNHNSTAADILIDQKGRIFIGGTTYKTNTRDFILLCLDQDGKLINSFGENGLVYTDFYGGKDALTSMIFDSDENIILGGNSESTESYYMALAKVLNNFNVGTLDDATTSEMQFIYPNPVTDQATLKFSIKETANVSIHISDLNGNTIGSIMNQHHFNAGEHQIELKMPGDILPGYYFISIHSGSQIKNVKFLKL